MSITLDGTTGITTPDLSTADGQVYAKENILGTVSQSSGVPTGAIIERGSNANGEFVKFADGTMIATGTVVTGTNWSSYGSALFTSPVVTWTFPVTFSTEPIVLTNERASNGVLTANDSTSTTESTGRAMFSSNLGSARTIKFTAIGHWF